MYLSPPKAAAPSAEQRVQTGSDPSRPCRAHPSVFLLFVFLVWHDVNLFNLILNVYALTF